MNNKLVQRTLDIAYAICPLNIEQRCSHIAFLIKNGRIHHIGINNGSKTHPITRRGPYHRGKIGVHAEISAILKSGREDLKHYTLMVYRVDRTGRLANSKPCAGCQSLIQQFGIKDVYYSDAQETVQYIGL